MDQQPNAVERPDDIEPPVADEPYDKQRRRWFQFRLRTLLIVVAILAVPLTYVAHVISTAGHKSAYMVFRVAEVAPSIWPTNDKPDREEFERYKRTLAELARSDLVVNRALDSVALRNVLPIKQNGAQAADWLTDRIVVNNPADSEILEIGVQDIDQQQAATIVQALANAFQTKIVDAERTEKLMRRDDLDKKFRTYKTTIIEKQRQLFQLGQTLGGKDDHHADFNNRLYRLDQAALEADRLELQAELQIARGKHKLAGLAETAPEYKATKSEIDLAENDRKFWIAKSESLTTEINETAKQMAAAQKFTGDADQLRIDVAQLQEVVNEMGRTLTKWNIDLGAAPRVTMIGPRSD